MGSWNVTCALSGLPIIRDNKVKVMILVSSDMDGFMRRHEKEDFSHFHFTGSGSYWTPVMFPISGVYNEYGTIEEIQKDENVKLIVDFFKEEQKNHKSFRISTRYDKYGTEEIDKKDPLGSIESILSLIERGYLEMMSIHGNLVRLSLMFMHDEIYTAALESVSDKKIFFGGYDTPENLLKKFGERSSILCQEQEDSICKYTKQTPRKVSSVFCALYEARENFRKMPHDIIFNTNEVMEQYGKEAFCFEMFLMEFGKSYAPHRTQICDHFDMEPVVKFNSVCLKMAKKMKKQWDEYCEG